MARAWALADIERAILAACARHKFRATVVAPGVINARRLAGATPSW